MDLWEAVMSFFVKREDIGIVLKDGRIFYFKDEEIDFFDSEKIKGTNVKGQEMTIQAFEIERVGSSEEIKENSFFC